MKRAVVMGAGGFIGSHMCKRLKAEGYWVRGVDLKWPEFSDTQADDFVIGDLRYVRITNLGNTADTSGSADIRLTLKNTTNEEFALKLPSGKTFMYNGSDTGAYKGVSSSMTASGSALSSSLDTVFASLSNITARSSGSNCNLEYFVASI